MKRVLVVSATFLLVSGGAAAVGALDNLALKGSDTLEHVTTDVLAACPGATAANTTYLGTGSTAGENAMTAGTQTVAPMSRFLNPTKGVCDGAPSGTAGFVSGAGGSTAEGLVIGLDGLSIVAGQPNAAACGGGLAFSAGRSFAVTDSTGAAVVNCSGCDAGTNTYHLQTWKDVLALVYAGKTHAMSGTTRDCANDVRRSLVDNWGSLFEGTCTGATCTQLRRAFRRADLSGTTDTFLGLVGLNSMPLANNVAGATAKQIDFCNANSASLFGGDSDYLDNDPIRRPCDANEEACGKDGKLGLVTVVEVPGNLTNAQNHPTTLCTLGKFRLVKPSTNNSVTTCPNGGGLLLGKCFQPTIENTDGTFTADCLARKTPVQGLGGGGMDGRAYNLASKNADGTYRKDTRNRPIVGSYYRVHTTKVTTVGAPVCTLDDATVQIGCLARANGCALGFAGREAESITPAGSVVALTVNAKAPTQANIEALVLTPLDTSDDYPLARKLFFDTVVGFENLTGGELELAKCLPAPDRSVRRQVATNDRRRGAPPTSLAADRARRDRDFVEQDFVREQAAALVVGDRAQHHAIHDARARLGRHAGQIADGVAVELQVDFAARGLEAHGHLHA